MATIKCQECAAFVVTSTVKDGKCYSCGHYLPITYIECPNCNHKSNSTKIAVGDKAVCSKCKHKFIVDEKYDNYIKKKSKKKQRKKRTSSNFGILFALIFLFSSMLPWSYLGSKPFTLWYLAEESINFDYIGVLLLIMGSLVLIVNAKIAAIFTGFGIFSPLWALLSVYEYQLEYGGTSPSLEPSIGIGLYIILIVAGIQLWTCLKPYLNREINIDESISSEPKSEQLDIKAELNKYKEMFDDGLIEKEDYDAKKKELLGL